MNIFNFHTNGVGVCVSVSTSLAERWRGNISFNHTKCAESAAIISFDRMRKEKSGFVFFPHFPSIFISKCTQHNDPFLDRPVEKIIGKIC